MSGTDKFFPTKFPGYYVSRSGKVFREPIPRDHTKELVEVTTHLRGGAPYPQYSSVNISLKENGRTYKQIRYYVHRLVAETLLENPHNFTDVNHIDEDKQNNCVDNLEWLDHKANLDHSEARIDVINSVTRQ